MKNARFPTSVGLFYLMRSRFLVTSQSDSGDREVPVSARHRVGESWVPIADGSVRPHAGLLLLGAHRDFSDRVLRALYFKNESDVKHLFSVHLLHHLHATGHRGALHGRCLRRHHLRHIHTRTRLPVRPLLRLVLEPPLLARHQALRQNQGKTTAQEVNLCLTLLYSVVYYSQYNYCL